MFSNCFSIFSIKNHIKLVFWSKVRPRPAKGGHNVRRPWAGRRTFGAPRLFRVLEYGGCLLLDRCKISCLEGGGAPEVMQVGMVLHAGGGVRREHASAINLFFDQKNTIAKIIFNGSPRAHFEHSGMEPGSKKHGGRDGHR